MAAQKVLPEAVTPELKWPTRPTAESRLVETAARRVRPGLALSPLLAKKLAKDRRRAATTAADDWGDLDLDLGKRER